jgi:hypothetical protein
MLWLPGGQSYAVDATADSGNRSIRVPNDLTSQHKIKATAHSGNVIINPAD